MPAPQIVHLRSSLIAVLAAVRAQLATTGIPASRIRWVARRRDKELPPLQGDQDAILRDRGFLATGHRDRHDCRIFRKLGVMVRTRNELSEVDDDESWMRHASLGNIVFEELVFDALQNFLPEDAKNNTLLFEAMKVLPGDAREYDGDGWGSVELIYQAGITLPLNQSRV